MSTLRPLLLMFYAPARGMAEVRDTATVRQAALLALLLHGAHAFYAQWATISTTFLAGGVFSPLRILFAVVGVLLAAAGVLLLISIVFVPLAILLANLFERRGSAGMVIRQEFGATATTVFYGLAAASLFALPLALVAKVTGLEASSREALAAMGPVMETLQNAPPGDGPPEEATRAIAAALPPLLLMFVMQPLFLFGAWAVAAVREIFRLSWLRAALVTLFSLVLTFFASPLLLVVFSTVLAIPILLVFVLFMLYGYLGEVARAQRARADFKRNLEAATLNPADASAHYNLGLVHQQRKEYEEARARFERAIEIDPEEVDAHYQLGRIARVQGRLADTIGHFEQVVMRDDAHSQHEVWREIGATYVAAGQYEDAQGALERFLENRQSDPEGLYLMGRAHDGQGRRREAAEWMRRCIEAVKTAPAYKYRTEKRWLNEAQQFLRTQS